MQTRGRGDFAAALWLLSHYLHTSLLSSALPYLRVGDKSPPLAPRWPYDDHFLILTIIPASPQARVVSFFFCYFIAA